nr:sperm-associated antigen 1 [Leptinotarsa decemlineata]
MTPSNDFQVNSNTQFEKETLLSKYKIPIQHFEYDFIEKCNDGKELEKILLVLRSGEEGHYPDLINTTERRLSTVKPKSKLLKKVVRVLEKQDLRKDELEEISEDLNEFVLQVSKTDRELESRKSNKSYHEVDVRCFKEFKNADESSKVSQKRIASTDYGAWDKYDPDTELLKMELEEEKNRKSVSKPKDQVKPKKTVTFNYFTTEAEAIFYSNREKEKGNEFFKTGDYVDALQCYTNSIKIKANVNNLNNRAATFLKLKKYQEALEDCERVLNLEKNNLKARLRKAEALEKLQRFEEALESVEFVIRKDPNNCTAQELSSRMRERYGSELKNTRLKITEIE